MAERVTRRRDELDENVVIDLVRNEVVTDTFRRLPSAKKARVYQVALQLFGEFGYDGLSVDQLCREAGISKGSFFQYFPSKTHLLEFCVLVFDHYLAERTAEIRASDTAVLARERLLHLYRSVALNSRLFPAEEKFYLLVTRALNHSAVALEGIDVGRHFDEYVTEIIRRGEQTGEIRGDFDARLTAHMVALIIEALVGRSFEGKGLSRHEAERYLISFLFDGIKA